MSGSDVIALIGVIIAGIVALVTVIYYYGKQRERFIKLEGDNQANYILLTTKLTSTDMFAVETRALVLRIQQELEAKISKPDHYRAIDSVDKKIDQISKQLTTISDHLIKGSKHEKL